MDRSIENECPFRLRVRGGGPKKIPIFCGAAAILTDRLYDKLLHFSQLFTPSKDIITLKMNYLTTTLLLAAIFCGASARREKISYIWPPSRSAAQPEADDLP